MGGRDTSSDLAFAVGGSTGPSPFPSYRRRSPARADHGEGSAEEGRWNTSASPMIYTGEHYSLAMLEKLVHGNGHMPPNQHWIAITIPPGVSYEVFSVAHHPGWDAEDCCVAKAYGEAWRRSMRSLLLMVPSVVARMERNVLINDGHAEVGRIAHGLHEPIWWDRRLFPDGPARGGGARRSGRR
jgi:RES domain-containing protein